MGNIRDNRKNGGVVLTDEEKKRLESIMKGTGQSKIDDIISKNIKKEDEKKEDKNKKEEIKLRGYLTKSKNPLQATVDAIIKQQQEQQER